MSDPDYSLCAEDHRTLLIVVQDIGTDLSHKSFKKIFDRICQIQYVKIQDSGGTRCIWMRYKSNYSPGNNEWGDFQTYRKVLGLISIGKCNQNNVEELCKDHNALQEQYRNSVFDSRCLLFSTDITSPSEVPFEGTVNDSASVKASCLDNACSPVSESAQTGVFKDNVEPVPKSHVINDVDGTNSSSKSTFDTYNSKDSLPMSDHSRDFNSLPNVKMSENSVDNENLNGDSTKELNSIENNNSSFRIHPGGDASSLSSSKKCFISSSLSSRSTHCIIYPGTDACDQLEYDIKDFINSLFWILESKRLDRSFEKQDKIPLLTVPFEKKNFVGIDTDTRVHKKRCLGRMKK